VSASNRYHLNAFIGWELEWSKTMRLFAIPLLMAAAPAIGQTESVDPATSRAQVNSEALAVVQGTTATQRATTLAGGTRRGDARISQNEAYNLSRASSGRLGVRLGNDMSFPIGKDGR
jgi:hypothetical protein